MGMGITNALKLQEGSIQELALLPQDLLMQMAQTGRLAPTLLPVVLNEKAQMAKQAANAQVLAKSAQGKPPSVIEQDMATNAQAEQTAGETPDTGIAALPVSDQVFRAAGGGIVAFEDGGKVPKYRDEGYVQFPSDTFGGFTATEDTAPTFVAPDIPEELVGRIGLAQVKDIQRGRYGTKREDILKAFGITPSATRAAAPAAAAPTAAVVAPPAAPAPAPASVRGIPAASAAATKTVTAPAEMTVEQWKKRQAEFGVDDDVQKRYEELIARTRETAGDREMAKNMALLQAGLGIMGGSSPYALQNIGEGAKGAVSQYSKDIKEIRAAERDADKMRLEMAKAQDAQKRGDFKAYQEHSERARDLSLKAEKLQIDREIAAAQKGYYGRPSEEQLRQEMFRKDPEGFRRYQESQRPGFETAAMQRAKVSLEQINSALLTMKKDDPQRKVLETERKRLLDQLSGRGAEVPPNVQSVIDKYLPQKQ